MGNRLTKKVSSSIVRKKIEGIVTACDDRSTRKSGAAGLQLEIQCRLNRD